MGYEKGENKSTNDLAVTESNGDLLEIEQYIDGLKSFVSSCETPLTLSIQGKWGAGKSSIMKLLQNALEGKDDSNSKNSGSNGAKQVIKTLYFNTWQYSQINENLYENFITYLISNIIESKYGRLKKAENKYLYKEKILPLLKPILDFGLSKLHIPNDFLEVIQKGSDTIYEQILTARLSQIEMLDEYKEKFSKLIQDALPETNPNSRFVFFIDDLDRLSPDQALSLLEIIKLFLDVPNCVFILAIDYDVVIEGVRRKYGTHFSREKGQEFFDKIIQVPFNVPTYTYKIGKLMEAGIDPNTLDNFNQVVAFTSKCTENNPRTIKRVLNSYNLMKAIFNYENENVAIKKSYHTCLYLIQCIQHTYNELYIFLIQNWNSVKENLDKNDSSMDYCDDLEKYLAPYNLSELRRNKIIDIYEELITIHLKKYPKLRMIFTEALNNSARSNNLTNTGASVSEITLQCSPELPESSPVSSVADAFVESVSFILNHLKPEAPLSNFTVWLLPLNDAPWYRSDQKPNRTDSFRACTLINDRKYIVGTSSSTDAKIRRIKKFYSACASDGVSIVWSNDKETVLELPLINSEIPVKMDSSDIN